MIRNDEHTVSKQAENPVGQGKLPAHIAIIMDGNGRWAKRRMMPRIYGHKKGVETLRNVTRACGEMGIGYLTVFAFSSENWRRPADEVGFLMNLFIRVLASEIKRLNRNNVRLRVVGDRQRFPEGLVAKIESAEAATANNTGLVLTIAADYGGRWDILNATRTLLTEHPEKLAMLCEDDLTSYLSMAYAPEPDLFIRTGGEQRTSNFLLWQLAYTELYFTDLAWPDFDRKALEDAIAWYAGRERRFGMISEQLESAAS